MAKTIYSSYADVLRQRLTALRKAARLNQRELARRIDRRQPIVAYIEMGQRRVDVIEFYWYCRACEANPRKAILDLYADFDRLAREKRTPSKAFLAPRGLRGLRRRPGS